MTASSPTSEPQTPEQWQLAVDAAQGVLATAFIQALGFVEGGPEYNVARCVDVLERASDMGITPSEDAIREWIGETTNELDTDRVYRVFLKAHEMSGHPDLKTVVPFLTADEYA